MVRLTNHDRLQCRPPEPLRFGHPQDGTLDLLAEQMIKRQRGYKPGERLTATDPAMTRLRAQLYCERDVARYLMAPYRPTVDDHGSRSRIITRHGVPVGVVVRKRKVDPKGRASMPELLVPVEWTRVSGLAIVFAVWVDDGCAPYLAGWGWEDEIRQGPSSFVGSRVFHKRAAGKLYEMQRLVTASPYVPTRQISLEHAR